MAQTPFKYLKSNINKVKFDCEPKYLSEYRRAFGAVLDRLDVFFRKNNLYECVDYQRIVEKMIAPDSKFKFEIDKSIAEVNYAGIHRRFNNGNRIIGMSPEYMSGGTRTEGVLCHEFIHYLTVGQEVLFYQKDGESFEVELPHHGVVNIGGVKRNLTQRKVDALEAGSALDGGFICEAFTELTKQQIYAEDESYHSYIPQTSLIKFLNNLTGTQTNLQDFLRGDLPNYIQILGRKNFQEFNSYCESFQKRFSQNASINYMQDPDYIKAQNLIVTCVLQNIKDNPQNYTASDFVRIASTIIAEYPTVLVDVNAYNRYKSQILSAKADFVKSQNLTFEQKKQFASILDSTIAQEASKKQDKFIPTELYSDFAFKQTPNGFMVSYKGGPFIDSSQFPNLRFSYGSVKYGNMQLKVGVTEKGEYKVEAIDTLVGTTRAITIMQSKTGELLISSDASEKAYKLNFNAQKKIRDKSIDANLALLENFSHYNQLMSILSSSEERIYAIKKVVTSSGQEYLVASFSGSAKFYKITANGYEIAEVISTEKTNEQTPISRKVIVGDKQNGMIGYMKTGEETDNSSVVYTLNDGTKFVSYFAGSSEAFAEQISPFNLSNQIFATCENQTLYFSANPSTKNMVGSASSWATMEVERQPKGGDGREEAEKTARAEEMRRQSQCEEEIQRRRQEEQRHRKLAQEEMERRDKELQEERKRQQAERARQESEYQEKKRRMETSGKVIDEYGVDISEIERARGAIEQSVGFGRGK